MATNGTARMETNLILLDYIAIRTPGMDTQEITTLP
jgi:hypothetical protein